MNKFLRAIRAGRTRARLTTPVGFGTQTNNMFGAVAGLTFVAPVEQAVITTKLSLPWQTLCGYAYPTQMQFKTIQAPPFFTPKSVPISGIGIQQGILAITPATTDYGEFVE